MNQNETAILESIISDLLATKDLLRALIATHPNQAHLRAVFDQHQKNRCASLASASPAAIEDYGRACRALLA